MLTIEAPATINLFTINDIYNQTITKIKHKMQISYDLSNVKEIDTTGVAFLLELKSYAKKVNADIKLINAPTHLHELSKLYQIIL